MKNIPAKLLLLVTILVAFLVIQSDREQAAKKESPAPAQRAVEPHENAEQKPSRLKTNGEPPASRLVLPMEDRLMSLASISIQ